MKRFSLWICTTLIISLLPSLVQAQEGHNIKFEINNYSDSIAFLAYRYGDKNMLQDTVVVPKGGKFTFEGSNKLAGGIYALVNARKQWLFDVLIDDDQSFTVYADTVNYVTSLKFKGSAQNTRFLEYRDFISGKGRENSEIGSKMKSLPPDSEEYKLLNEKRMKINDEVLKMQQGIIDEMPGSLLAYILKAQQEVPVPEEVKKDQQKHYQYYKEHFWDNIDFTDDRVVRTPIYDSKLKQYMRQLVPQHPDSVIVDVDRMFKLIGDNKEFYKFTFVYFYQKYNSSKVMCIDKVFVHLALKYYTKKKAFWATDKQLKSIRERAMTLAPVTCGEIAPNMRLKDLDNNWHELHTFDAEYTVLLFWDPNCGHCKKDIPALRSKIDSLKAFGAEVFAITTQQDEPDWREFIDKHDLIWLNVTDNPKDQFLNNFRDVYDVYSTPKIFLLDRNKVIRGKGFGSDQVIKVLEGVMEEEKARRKKQKITNGSN